MTDKMLTIIGNRIENQISVRFLPFSWCFDAASVESYAYDNANCKHGVTCYGIGCAQFSCK
jgi:hypothetical protein